MDTTGTRYFSRPPTRGRRGPMTQKLVFLAAVLLVMVRHLRAAPAATENFFANPGFEMVGPGSGEWHLDRGGDTAAEFTVDRQDAAEGERSALVHIGHVADWGVQFGQIVAPGKRGTTYTFAVRAKAVQKPVTVALQIERCANPYDRAAKGGPFTIEPDRWTELHVTFTVEKEFPQGWFAYISCEQADCEFRADAFRLYPGAYVPGEQLVAAAQAAGGVQVLPAGDNEVGVSNNFVTLTARKGSGSAAVRYRLGQEMIKGPWLMPVAADGAAAQTITGFHLVENKPDKALLEVDWRSATGKKLVSRFLVRADKPVIEAQAGDGMDRLRIESSSRYVVVPDIFAGDLVVPLLAGAPAPQRLPSENVVAHLTDAGNAIVVCAWRARRQAVRLVAGAEPGRTTTEIDCRAGAPVAVAVLAAPGIWYQEKMSDLDPVKDVQLDWSVPFRALWRADYRRADGLIDSWKMPIRKAAKVWEGFGVSFNQAKTRTVWTSARGTFAYPACIDGNHAFLRRTHFEEPEGLEYKAADSVLIYPFARVTGTPAAAWGVFDVLADTLAGTPEEKLLDDLEIKRVARDRYPATCAVTAEYESVFEDGAEKAKKSFLLERLGAMDHFVMGIRSRIEEYQAWRQATGAFIAEQKAAQPELAPLADAFAGVLAKFESRSAALQLVARNPAAAKLLIAKVAALIDSPESDKAEKAKQIGRDTRTIGGSQDHAIGDFRMITKELRQRAGLAMLAAPDAASFEFARAVRERTLVVLGCAFGHEGAQTD